MASRYGEKFDHVLRTLRKECPVNIPVKVVTGNLGQYKLCGSCTAFVDTEGNIQSFVIEIDKHMSISAAIDTLMHEWAHAMDKEANGIPNEPHRNSWGVCYARAWRAYFNNVE